MPIYTYRCASCGAQFERLVRAGTRVSCPQCESRELEQLMSLTARPASARAPADYSRLGPPAGGCCGGGCHSHNH